VRTDDGDSSNSGAAGARREDRIHDAMMEAQFGLGGGRTKSAGFGPKQNQEFNKDAQRNKAATIKYIRNTLTIHYEIMHPAAAKS
jgi:hypothetical protein